ncbi:ribonuclease III, partial [Candidatus Falkowbacteria bacterium]|nr:ribonuclease III [Candidatus Falkowbacteria bacterium]
SPGSTKGGLTNSRKSKVKKEALAVLAKNLGLDKVLIIPEHRVKAGGRKNEKNLHTVYEAVVGAIYRDRGYESARDFVVRTCI